MNVVNKTEKTVRKASGVGLRGEWLLALNHMHSWVDSAGVIGRPADLTRSGAGKGRRGTVRCWQEGASTATSPGGQH